MKNSSLSYWQNVAFTDGTQERLASDGIVSFMKKWNNLENFEKVSRDKILYMFWGATRFLWLQHTY